MAGNKRELLGSRLTIPPRTFDGPPPKQDFQEEGTPESQISDEEIGPPGHPLAMLTIEEAASDVDAKLGQEIDSSPTNQPPMPTPSRTALDKPVKRRGRPPKNQKKTDNQEKRNVLHFEVSEEVARKFEELFAPGVPGRFKSQSELIRFYVYKGLEKELELMRDFQKVLDRREKRDN